jgi:hypothetical protein
MYFLNIPDKGIIDARFTNKTEVINIARSLKGTVTNAKGEIVYPFSIPECKTPRWVINPRIKREPTTIISTIRGMNEPTNYKQSPRAQVIYEDGTKQDLASQIWNMEVGNIPLSYYVRHKNYDVNDNRLSNLELAMVGCVYPIETINEFRPMRLMRLKKFNEVCVYHHSGIVHVIKGNIDLRGSNDPFYPRPVIKEREKLNVFYDLASMCWMQAFERDVPSFFFIGFRDLNPNNLSLDNLELTPRPYSEEQFREEYTIHEGHVVFKKWMNKVTFPLKLPSCISLNKTKAISILENSND